MKHKKKSSILIMRMVVINILQGTVDGKQWSDIIIIIMCFAKWHRRSCFSTILGPWCPGPTMVHERLGHDLFPNLYIHHCVCFLCHWPQSLTVRTSKSPTLLNCRIGHFATRDSDPQSCLPHNHVLPIIHYFEMQMRVYLWDHNAFSHTLLYC